MPECNVDIDRLGTLTLEHFEQDSIQRRCCNGFSSNDSSPSYIDDYLESPVSSPNQASSPTSSDSCSFHSDEETSEKFGERKTNSMKRSQKVKESVSKRNERERKRVKLISEGFSTLKNHVLIQPSNRKLPKLQILRRAIDYIKAMQDMLEESDMQMQIENQRKRDRYRQSVTQTSVLFPPTDKPDHRLRCYPTMLQRPYTEVYHPDRPPRRDVPWFHGYTQ